MKACYSGKKTSSFFQT